MGCGSCSDAYRNDYTDDWDGYSLDYHKTAFETAVRHNYKVEGSYSQRASRASSWETLLITATLIALVVIIP